MPALRTVLLFAHECAPYNRPISVVGSQRPAQFAKYLPVHGWRAIVLCCDYAERETGCPPDLADRVRRALRAAPQGESVIIPTPSLPSAGLMDALWRRMQPGATDGRAAAAARSLVRKPLTVAKLWTGDYSQAWQPCARIAADVIARETRIDACLGEHSPDAGIFLAKWFSSKYGVPWVADFRDPVLHPLPPVLRGVYHRIARRLLRTASWVINATPFWSELDAQLFGRPVATITNGFDPEEFPPASPPRNDALTIAFHGGMTAEMDMPIFMRGLALLRDRLGADAARVRFVYRGHAHAQVARWAAEAGVSAMVATSGMIPRLDALARLQQSDILLLLSVANPAARSVYLKHGLYPGKTFEYFGAGRPILCVPGDDGGQLDELLARTRTGHAARTPEEVAAYLERAFHRWRAGERQPYAPNLHEVRAYTREALSGKLAELLDASCGVGAETRRRSAANVA